MSENEKMALFGDSKIRRLWDGNNERWLFSVIDVVGALSNSTDPRNYWKVLKSRLKDEECEVVTKCNQLKMKASDGKYYLTDTADTETLLRIIQSIPSPNAEPFKLWLARVGYERVEEAEDPELAGNPRCRFLIAIRTRHPVNPFFLSAHWLFGSVQTCK